MSNCLVLVRGLPGSGKSTFASALAGAGFKHFEADMFFVRDGVYQYDPAQRKDAHAWCQQQAFVAMADGFNVVVSNTFTQRWEMAPYREVAEARGIAVYVVEMTGEFGTIHNVPEATIEAMKARWESANDPHARIQRVMEQKGYGLELDAALMLCDDPECTRCSRIVCPEHDHMHFHHDGCPSCEQRIPSPFTTQPERTEA